MTVDGALTDSILSAANLYTFKPTSMTLLQLIILQPQFTIEIGSCVTFDFVFLYRNLNKMIESYCPVTIHFCF